MLCDEIQKEGVEAFADSFDQLIDAIARKATPPSSSN
jgi:hypothetical protein